MIIESELTIEEHCNSLRNKVDTARETALENIHKASNKLMSEIDAYERECLSGWTEAKESSAHVVEDVSKQMRALLAEQHAFLQSVQASDDELTLRLDEAKKFAEELSDRKMELKAAMFGNKLASFVAFPGIDDTLVSLGELAFSTIKIPFKTLDIANNELTPIDVRVDYDFVLPLEHGRRLVAFEWVNIQEQFLKEESYSKMTCVDRLGRLLCSDYLNKHRVRRQDVAQCGPNQFVMCYDSESPKLSVFNSSLHRLRTVECKKFSNICCNSKFVFGLIGDVHDSFDSEEDDYDEYFPYEYYCRMAELYEQGVEPSSQRIPVLHLDTLSKAFQLRGQNEYSIEQIVADEHHVVALSQHDSERGYLLIWYISIFNLATCNETRTFFLAEKTIYFTIESLSLPRVFLFDGWLVFPLTDEGQIVWFDKEGKRSKRITKWDSNRFKDIFTFGSGFLFTQHDSKILLKL